MATLHSNTIRTSPAAAVAEADSEESARRNVAVAATTPRKMTRLSKFTLNDIQNLTFPRACCIQLEESGILWPCLYFPSYNAMIQELETSGFVTQEDEIEIALSMFEAENEQKISAQDDGSMVPLVLLVSLNKVILKPDEHKMTYLSNGVGQMIGTKDPLLFAAMRNVSAAVGKTSRTISVAGRLKRPAPVTEKANAVKVQATPTTKSMADTSALATCTTSKATVPVATATSASESPALDRKHDTEKEKLPEVSPGGDSVQIKSSSNKRAKLSETTEEMPEYKNTTDAGKQFEVTQTSNTPAASSQGENQDELMADAPAKDTLSESATNTATTKAKEATEDNSARGHLKSTESKLGKQDISSVDKERKSKPNSNDGVETSAITMNSYKERAANKNFTSTAHDKPKTKASTKAVQTPAKAKTSKTKASGEKQPKTSAIPNPDKPEAKSQVIFDVLLDDEERKIPNWYDVRDLLKSAGFVERAFNHPTDAEFYFPGADPRKGGCPIEGETFFKTMDDFKARLCAYGLGENVDADLIDPSTPEGAKLERWIRLSAFAPQIKQRQLLSEAGSRIFDFKAATELGFAYRGGAYGFPDATPGSVWAPQGTPLYFDNEKDFRMHLSRFGFPGKHDFGTFSDDQLSRFVLPLVFMERDLFNPCPGTGRRRSAKKAAKAVASAKKANMPRPVPATKASVLETPLETSEPLSSSPSKCDKNALEDCNRNPPGKANRYSLKGRNINDEIEEASNDASKLQQCLTKLESTSPSSDTWLGSPNNHFQENALKVRSHLDEMVRSRAPGTFGNTKNSLYICGTPGIGKTTAVNWCSEYLIATNKVENILGDTSIDLVAVNINCSQFSSGGESMKKSFYEKVWSESNGDRRRKSKGDSEKAVADSLKTKNPRAVKKFIILVLDEIDQLVDDTSDAQNPKTAGEKLLCHLSNWATDGKMRFAMIGIGNAMNNNKYRRVNKFASFQHTISFQAFDEADIEQILRFRLKDSSVVHPAAFTFIAKKWSSGSGDVRKAIEHMTTAIKIARSQAHNQTTVESQLLTGAPKQGQYLVSMKDVIKVHGAAYAELSKCIADLPLYSKIAVHVAANLAKNSNEGEIFRRDLLRDFISFYTENFSEAMDIGDAGPHIDGLYDIGIASIKFSNSHDSGDDTFKFNYLSHELEEAASVALKNDGFFSR